jgi:hypothetical protein
MNKMPKPKKKSLQEIIDDMKDLHDHEEDLLQELESHIGTIDESDFDFMNKEEN